MRRVILSLTLAAGVWAQSELNFLSSHVDGREITEMLSRHLRAKAIHQLEQRRSQVQAISTAQQLSERRRLFRERFTRGLGDFPAKTPLNARIAASLDFPDYKIEKVIFESQPGFHVTANLYLPKSATSPHPAILFPLGH